MDTFVVGKDGSLSSSYTAALAAHAGDRLLGLVIGRQVSRPERRIRGRHGVVVGEWQDVAQIRSVVAASRCPRDNSALIVSRLRRSVGQDNFEYLIAVQSSALITLIHRDVGNDRRRPSPGPRDGAFAVTG